MAHWRNRRLALVRTLVLVLTRAAVLIPERVLVHAMLGDEVLALELGLGYKTSSCADSVVAREHHVASSARGMHHVAFTWLCLPCTISNTRLKRRSMSMHK